MKLLFEKSKPGKSCVSIRNSGVRKIKFGNNVKRTELDFPELPEIEVVRHYTELSNRAHGVDSGFYPLGSCTMKYNPKINEDVAALPDFTNIHPTQSSETVEGSLQVIKELTKNLCEITGMDAASLQPAAGAHGEYASLLMIAAYHESRGDGKRNKIIVPDSAHGTNPASAAMAGFEVINIASNGKNEVDLNALRQIVGGDTAGLMLTNPTTLGLFEKNIKEISDIVHNAGGLMYYDGANLNAIMGITRPGDMGFDVIHLNLHKTFSTPHGGGGPGSGPVGCKKFLEEFLPGCPVINKKSIGNVLGWHGNFGVYVKALAYIKTLGGEGIRESAEAAVLNANYLKSRLEKKYSAAKGYCMHEFVLSLEELKERTGVAAIDIAKAMIDYKIHPPTMYFPLIVHEALMFEPTETETKETLDECAEVLLKLYDLASADPGYLHNAPHGTAVGRPDDVAAARNPILKYKK